MTKATGRPVGRPRKAASLAVLHGDRARPAAPSVRSQAIDDAPSYLSDDEREHWQRLAPELLRLGRLTVLSSPALADHCRQLVMADQMRSQIATDGLTHPGQRGEMVKHPLLSPLGTVNSQIAATRLVFGLVPVANERFAPVVEPPNQYDGSDLLSSGGGTNWT